MPRLAHLAIIALLSLLLPLQTSIAYARAVGMTTGKAGLTASSVQPDATMPDSLPSAGHHHSDNAHAGNVAHPLKTEVEHSSQQKSGNGCDSGAKCCLAGAAAPPMIWSQMARIASGRAPFSSPSYALSCFIPDGPERPPRCL